MSSRTGGFGIAIVALLAACTASTPSTTARASSSLPSSTPPGNGFGPAWTADVGGFLSLPVVDPGVVYVSSEDGGLFAFPTSCEASFAPS